METLTLDFSATGLTDDQFYHLCKRNESLRFEMTSQGEIIVMSPVGGISGQRESDLITDVQIWNRRHQLGIVFSSSTVFRLPDGSKRSPDVAWVESSRWQRLSLIDQEKFPPLAPDFVIELRSKTDELSPLRAKMREYLSNGVRLGWMFNPQGQIVEVYEPGQPPQTIALPNRLSGGIVLPQFELEIPRFS
jgi:Uma2 family endonuclease